MPPSPGSRSRHHHRPPSRGGPPAGSRTPSPLARIPRSTSSSLLLHPSSALFVREVPRAIHGSTAIALSQRKREKLGKTATRSGNNSLPLQAKLNTIPSASGESTEGTGSSTLSRSSSRTARVTVRRAKERDYQGVAEIRGVIIPIGMSGATGFLGGKVVIDDPVEAERRLLMAKVCVGVCRPLSCYGAAAPCTTAV